MGLSVTSNNFSGCNFFCFIAFLYCCGKILVLLVGI